MSIKMMFIIMKIEKNLNTQKRGTGKWNKVSESSGITQPLTGRLRSMLLTGKMVIMCCWAKTVIYGTVWTHFLKSMYSFAVIH